MSKKTLPKWDEERTSNLVAIAGAVEDKVQVATSTVAEAAEALGTTARSVASKLRKLGYDVESASASKVKTFTDEQEQKIRDFLNENPNAFTYAEIAVALFNDEDMAKKVQGKILSMEMSSLVKKAIPKEVIKAYTETEELQILEMVKNGEFIEDISDKLGKKINSVRGKILSMINTHGITMPKQKESHSKKAAKDTLESIGDLTELTVAEIAEKTDKTERGIKVMLTHRGLVAKDYDGAKRAQKIAEKKEAA